MSRLSKKVLPLLAAAGLVLVFLYLVRVGPWKADDASRKGDGESVAGGREGGVGASPSQRRPGSRSRPPRAGQKVSGGAATGNAGGSLKGRSASPTKAAGAFASPFTRAELENATRSLDETQARTIAGLLESPDPGMRRKAVAMLRSRVRSDSGVEYLMDQMLGDPDAGVRRVVVEAMSQVTSEESVEKMLGLVSDPDAGVRCEVARSLGRMGAKEVGQDLVGMLADSDGGVRREAARTLGRLRYAEATEALLGALQDSNDDVRRQAMSSLGDIGAAEALPRLRAMYDAGSPADRQRLALVCRQLGDGQPLAQEVTRLSRTVLEGADSADRETALRSLVQLDRNQARAVLQQAVRDPDPKVRELARKMLGQGAGDEDD